MPRIITKIERLGPPTPRIRQPDSSLAVQQDVMFQTAESIGRLDPCDNDNKICFLLTKIPPKSISLIIAQFCVIY